MYEVVLTIVIRYPLKQVPENQSKLSEYELKRLKRIEENKAVLRSLNIIQVG